MAENAQTTVRGKRGVQYVCTVPAEHCSGGFSAEKDGVAGKFKVHSTPEQVGACKIKYLEKLGYKRVGSRLMEPPDDGPLLVLCKKSLRAKPGKGGRYMSRCLRIREW